MWFLAVALTATQNVAKAQDMALKSNILYDLTTTVNLDYEVAINRQTTFDVWVNYNPWTLGHKWVGLDLGDEAKNSLNTGRRDSKLRHFMVQPEVRWWLCEKFNGHFFGVHLHGGIYNVGALTLPFDWGRYKDAEGEYLGKQPVEMTAASVNKTTEETTYRKVTGVQYAEGLTPYSGLAALKGKDYASQRDQMVWSNADRDGIYTNSFEGWAFGAGVSYGYHWILAQRWSLEFTLGLGYAYLKYEKSRCTDCKLPLEEGVIHYFGPTRAGISLVYMLK